MTKHTYTIQKSGQRLTLNPSDVESIRIDDIVNNICKIPRFCGALSNDWTVGHHSVFVMDAVSSLVPEFTLWALMHDFCEYAIGDFPAPFKPQDVKDIESNIQRRIYAKYDVPEPSEDCSRSVKKMDQAAAIVEAEMGGLSLWQYDRLLQPYIQVLKDTPICHTPRERIYSVLARFGILD